MEKPHHTFLRTIGNLSFKDKVTEWWTVTNENKFYDNRHTIPFNNLYCGDQQGGLVVYLDQPEVTHTCSNCGHMEVSV